MSAEKVNRWIIEAERKWLLPLEKHCSALFRDTFLPSHSAGHHRRVWENCKSILRETDSFNPCISEKLTEGLLVAAWFHDTGMAVDPGPSHGQHSRKLCEAYFEPGGVAAPVLLDEILDALENHDSKERMLYRTISAEEPPGILELLSVADDMDAFGITGIYRYTEIYLHRGMPLRELGIRILRNARLRFLNVDQCCRHCPALMDRIMLDFGILSSFFGLYNQQLAIPGEPENSREGHLGIVNHIRKYCIGESIHPSRLYEFSTKENQRLLPRYFLDLKNELGD